MAKYSFRDALQMICATEDESKNTGHPHRLAIKIARAALFGHDLKLSDDDIDRLEKNWPKGLASHLRELN